MTGRTPTHTHVQASSFPRRRESSVALKALFILAALFFPPAVFAVCPDLQTYYPTDDSSWPEAVQRLTPLMPECLKSAEYFALLGAAQMNNGQLTEALESLERALLIDPNHGAANVDYAQVLYLTGQLFPALEINTGLLQREDLPPELVGALQQRQQLWQAQTTAKGFSTEVAAGYDNNLNGAPSSSNFTLTLSGEAVQLTLDPEFQPISGEYLNLRLAGYYRKLTPERTHDLVFELRNRQSEHSASELLQFDWRYAQGLSLRRYRWDFVAGTSHLLYGGNPLYTVTEARTRLNRNGTGCRPQYELAMQHQLYHGQSFMRGLEAGATAGLFCEFGDSGQVLGIDAGPLINHALRDTRPGGDRKGWRLRLNWQVPLGQGAVSSQISYAQLSDDEGYSDLLAGGAAREIHNRFLRVQYSRPFAGDLTFLVTLNHQSQDSNLIPFESEGTALDVGLSLNF